jgi:hypothetical protein
MQQRRGDWEGKATGPDIVSIFSLSAALSELRRGLHGRLFLTALKLSGVSWLQNAGRCMTETSGRFENIPLAFVKRVGSSV